MKRAAIVIAAVIALSWLALLLTDTRVLVAEVKVELGQESFVEGYGNLKEDKQAFFVCSYFNGARYCGPCFGMLQTTSWAEIAVRSYIVTEANLRNVYA
jgi:hypothetical protein